MERGKIGFPEAGSLLRSIPGQLRERASVEPGGVAFREKRLGRYVEHSWSDVVEAVAETALGLAGVGLKAKDRVVLCGDPEFGLAVAELAVWSVGGISVGIDPRTPPEELGVLLAEADPSVYVVGNQEYLDKVLEACQVPPDSASLLVVDEGGLFLYDRPVATPLAHVRASGARMTDAERSPLEAAFGAVSPAHPAAVVFTGGTASRPKGVLHTHETLLHGARTLTLLTPDLADRSARSVVTLPLSDLVGKVTTIVLPLVTGLVPHFPEAPDTWSESIFEVAPTYMNERPGFWKRVAARVTLGVQGSSRLKRVAFARAVGITNAALRRHWNGRPVPFYLAVGVALARFAVLVPLLRQFGLHRLRAPLVGWSPVPQELVRDWQRRGLDLRIVYGLAEAFAVTGQSGRYPDPVDVGSPVEGSGCDVQLDSDGGVLVGSPSLAPGYWTPAGTPPNRDDLRSLPTGDIGSMENGRLLILGDEESIATARDGSAVLLQRVENEVKASHYVSEAFAYTVTGKVSVVVELDYETTSAWASARRLVYSTYADLVAKPEAQGLAEEAVRSANARLPASEQIEHVQVFPGPLDPMDGTLTTTGRVRRAALRPRFAGTNP